MIDRILHPPERLSRREFLGFSAFGLLALGVPLRWSQARFDLRERLLGRVAEPRAYVYTEPSFAGERVRAVLRDTLLPIDGAVVGGPEPAHNRVWYRVPGQGFLHSAPIQPVRDVRNLPLEAIRPAGELMEVTIPFVDARWEPSPTARRAYRYYYETTHWVNGRTQDEGGQVWYRVHDDLAGREYWAAAEAFRRVDLAELTPIAPDVPPDEKHIEVNLSEQWMCCSEAGAPVFMVRISSGMQVRFDLPLTPHGEFATRRKRPSRHMTGTAGGSPYDLPGVPWVAYLTDTGIAFHGTYWHNDFGVPRSRGCINMATGAARWLYRWTRPLVPVSEQEIRRPVGTRVRIRA